MCMKKIIYTGILSLFLLGCSDSSPSVSQQPTTENKPKNQQPETVAAHTLDKENEAKSMPTVEDSSKTSEKSDKQTKWNRGGDPIDVTELNAEVVKAEKDLKANSSDENLKKNLSKAYTKRAVALTDARQYASAIGDYRKALKYDETNEEAKTWIATITGIYKGMNREVPAEGEEPEPLPFEKKS